MNIYDIFCTLADGVFSHLEPHVVYVLFSKLRWPAGWSVLTRGLAGRVNKLD